MTSDDHCSETSLIELCGLVSCMLYQQSSLLWCIQCRTLIILGGHFDRPMHFIKGSFSSYIYIAFVPFAPNFNCAGSIHRNNLFTFPWSSVGVYFLRVRRPDFHLHKLQKWVTVTLSPFLSLHRRIGSRGSGGERFHHLHFLFFSVASALSPRLTLLLSYLFVFFVLYIIPWFNINKHFFW